MDEDTEQTEVAVDPLSPAATADELWKALAETNKSGEPHTVARFGRLCRFGRDDETNALELHEHDVDTLRDQISHKLRPVKASYRNGRWWVETDDKGGSKPTRLPNEAIQALVKRPMDRLDRQGRVPRVDRVVDVPVFGPEGELVERRGHHAEARLYYDGPTIQGLKDHWDDPDARQADVEAARHLLLDELLSDFPFEDEASRAHALALVVEQFARAMVDGPTPAYAIIAAEQGTGKSLLAQACLTPACGRVDLSPEPETAPQDFQKRLLSELIRGPLALVFDNVTHELENSALAAMLTSGRYSDRVLGKSQILSFPIRHTTVFTMNNPEIGKDMRRRAVPVYLNAGVERPWERTGPRSGSRWRHQNLLAWARANREGLVEAAITLVANYAAGWVDVDHTGEEYLRRAVPSRLLGGFDEWSRVMGGIVTAAGVPGFGGNFDRLFDEQSDDDAEEAAFLSDWPEERRMTAADVMQWVTVGLDGGLHVTEAPAGFRDARSGRVDPQTVGNGLRQMRGRVRGGLRLDNDRTVRPTQWFVVPA